MIWVERTPSTFCRAELRRIYRRGKRADRNAHFAQAWRDALDEIWAPVFRDEHPFLRSR